MRAILRSPIIKRPLVRTVSSQEALKNELYIHKLDGDLDGVVVLGLNRPRAMNSFNRNLAALLIDAVEDLKHDSNMRVLIMRSLVPGVFSTGADLKERATMKIEEVAPFISRVRQVILDLHQFECPTIAAIDGFALGGGLEIALSFDMRVASSNAKMGLVEAKWATIPGAGGTQTLARTIGLTKAKELIFTARMINGEEAHKIGLANYAVQQNEDGDAAFQKALELAKEIVPQGPVALRMAKKAINRGTEVDIASGLAFEQACYAQVIPTKDRIEGLTAFREKRAPVYKGK